MITIAKIVIPVVAAAVVVIVVVVVLCAVLLPKKDENQLKNPQIPVLTKNTFAQSLLGILDRNKSDLYTNIIVSPYSIKTALLMTAAGSSDLTFSEFSDVLRLPSNFTNAESIVSDEEISSFSNKEKPFQSTNSLWISQQYTFYEKYMNSIKQTFNSSSIPTDFSSPTVVEDVNAWISTETHGKITDLLEEIDPNTVMLLINALYFKGSWDKPFDPLLTQAGNFRHVDSTTGQASFMHQSGFRRHFKDEIVDAAFLDFGEDVSMLFIKPNVEGDAALLSVVGSYLTDDKIAEMVDCNYRNLDLQIPKFNVSYRHSLKEVLENLGLVRAFTPNAEFPFITPSSVKLNDVLHATTFVLNEDGVEATAATVVEVGPTSAPGGPVPFVLDRPFVFAVVYEKVSLFMGIIRSVEDSK